MGDQLVTAKELGEWLDLSTVRISALGREGVLPREGDRRYPLKTAVRAYASWSRLHPSGRRTADPDLADEKRRLTRAQADAAELKLAQTRGEMLPADEVAREWREVAVDLRAQVLAIGPRVASALGLDRDASARLDRELRTCLEDIADEP